MADISDTEKAYAAGLFDGEGCVQVYMKKSGTKKNGAKNRSMSTSLSVAGTDIRPLRWLQARYGGALRVTTKNGPASKRPLGIWVVFSLQAEIFAEDIRPYLLVKKEQLDLWFIAREMLLERGYSGPDGISEADVASRRELVETMKQMKRSNMISWSEHPSQT